MFKIVLKAIFNTFIILLMATMISTVAWLIKTYLGFIGITITIIFALIMLVIIEVSDDLRRKGE